MPPYKTGLVNGDIATVEEEDDTVQSVGLEKGDATTEEEEAIH